MYGDESKTYSSKVNKVPVSEVSVTFVSNETRKHKLAEEAIKLEQQK